MPLSLKQVDKEHTPHLFYLPRMTPHPAWAASTAYAIGDIVSVVASGKEYKCIVAHISGAEFIDNVLSFTEYGNIPYTYEDLPDNPGTFIDVPVYDYPHQEETYASGKGMRRRAKPKADSPDVPVDQTANARLEKIIGKQHFFVDNYYDGDLVATWELIPEYWDGNSWEFQELDGTVDIDNELGILTCTGVQGGFEWDIQIGFSADNSKWSIDITAPGFTVRVRQEIVFTALGQQMVADGDLRVGYEDFTGNVSDDQAVETRNIIYEPDGVDATSGWVVDPYLTVEEASNNIDITADGYGFRFDTDSTIADRSMFIYDTTFSSQWGWIEEQVTQTSDFNFSRDPNRVVTVIEEGPLRIVVNRRGTPYFITETSYIDGCDRWEQWFYFYSDRIIVHTEIDADVDGIVIDNSETHNQVFMFEWRTSNNENNIVENGSGVEDNTIGTNQTVTSRVYVGLTSDEANVIQTVLDTNITGPDWGVFTGGSDGAFESRLNNGTLTEGTHSFTLMWHIDSADRANDSGATSGFWDWDNDTLGNAVAVGKIIVNDGLRYYCYNAIGTAEATHEPGVGATWTDYWWEYRMTLGNQYKDLVMDAPDTGSEQTDWVIPKSFGSVWNNCTEVWDFNNDGGAAQIDGSHDLSENGTPTYSTDCKQGTHSAVLGGSGNSFYLPNDSDFDVGAADFSIAFWFKWDVDQNSGICSKYASGDGWFVQVAYATDDRYLHVKWYDGWNLENFATTFAPSVDTWYHVTISYDYSATDLVLWVSSDGGTFGDLYDNSSSPQNTTYYPDASTSQLKIGTEDRDSYPFAGHIDEFAFFKGKALSATEAESIYNGSWRGGFTTAGDRRLEGDTIEYTSDITRIGHVDAVEMGYYTGDPASPTDHLVGHWKMDDNAASTALIDEKGNSSCVTVGDNTIDMTSTDAVRGACIETNGSDNSINFVDSISDLTNDRKTFTLSFDFKPTFGYDTGAYQGLVEMGSSWQDYWSITYDYVNDNYVFNERIGGTATYTVIPITFTSDVHLQQWRNIQISVNLDIGMAYVFFNGQTMIAVATTSGAWTDNTPDIFVLGNENQRRNVPGAFLFDNVKLLDGCMLPYGAYATGNGSVDTAIAHSDILTFIKGDESTTDSLKIGTGTITIVNATQTTDPWGNADSAIQADASGEYASYSITTDGSQGAISCWWKSTVAFSAQAYSLFGNYSSFFHRFRNSNQEVEFYIDTTITWDVGYNLWDTNWHHFVFYWDEAKDIVGCIVDGVRQTESSVTTTYPDWSGGQTLYVGASGSSSRSCGGIISDFYLTSDPNTPQIPVFLGSGPMHAPIVQVD